MGVMIDLVGGRELLNDWGFDDEDGCGKGDGLGVMVGEVNGGGVKRFV